MNRAILAVLAVSACAPHIGYETDGLTGYGSDRLYRVIHDNGGEARREYELWQERAQTAKGFVLDGPCISACAYFVAGGKTCYTVNATLGLHPATYGGVFRTDFTRKFDQMILDSWPEGLQRLWADKVPNPDFGAGLIGYDATADVLREYWPEGECRPGFFKEES